MCFWLNYCDENHHIERILIAVKNINHLFYLDSEIIEADRFNLFLLSDDTRIDEDEYLSSLENDTELIVCTEEKIQKLLIYFEMKKKTISLCTQKSFLITFITLIFKFIARAYVVPCVHSH